MFKKFFAVLLLTATLLIVGGQSNRAEAYCAVVVDCREWISLRSYPSTDAPRLAEVPLGEWIWVSGRAGNGFVSAEYNGIRGYVLAAYTKYVKD